MVSVTKIPFILFAFFSIVYEFPLEFFASSSFLLFLFSVPFSKTFDDEVFVHESVRDDLITNKSTKKDYAIDPRNPYYVHPDENPSVSVVPPPPDDNNTIIGVIQCVVPLHPRTKSFSSTEPSTNPLSKTLILSFRITLITWCYPGSTALSHLIFLKTPFALTLHLIFWKIYVKEGNHFCFSDLLRDLHSIKQGDKALSQYFIELKTIWDKLGDLCPTPIVFLFNPFAPAILSRPFTNTNIWSMFLAFSRV